MSKGYVPDRGHAVWINFDPRVGREQSGRRPGLVLSTQRYNDRARLALICPITTKCKDYPFEVVLPDGLEVSGVVLADQRKSVAWEAREAEYLCHVPIGTVHSVVAKLTKLLK